MPLVHKRIPLHKGRVELNISIFMKIKCLIILFVQFIKHDIIYTKDLEVEG